MCVRMNALSASFDFLLKVKLYFTFYEKINMVKMLLEVKGVEPRDNLRFPFFLHF